jgi:magnesium-transporting ATPase (P-type)
MYTKADQTYYYYENQEQEKKMFYAKCIHESTFGTKRPVLPITREQFMRFTINTFVTFAIIAAVVFLFLFFQRIPYELSFCTVFFSILAFFYFFAVFALYRKAYDIYQENPKFAMEYKRWHKKVLEKNAEKLKHQTIREILFNELQPDSVVKIYFKDLTAKAYRKNSILMFTAIVVFSTLTTFMVSIDHYFGI